jgi:hypothetical protein
MQRNIVQQPLLMQRLILLSGRQPIMSHSFSIYRLTLTPEEIKAVSAEQSAVICESEAQASLIVRFRVSFAVTGRWIRNIS